MILWSGCFGAWFRHLTRRLIDPRRWTDCKLYYFLFYFGRHYSSTLLVLMSLEKCFAVYFPLKSKTVCTVQTAKWATGIVGVILGGYNLVHFFLRESKINKSGRHVCAVIGNNKVTLDAVDSALYSFGPFGLMFITNFAIAFKLMRAKCKSNQGHSTESTNQALVKSATRGTAMVVTVSITFLVLTAPVGVDNALASILLLNRKPLYEVFMNISQYLNHSINGVLYCIVGTRFRNELLKFLCGKNKTEHSTDYSCNNTNSTHVG